MKPEMTVVSKFSNNYREIIETYCGSINNCGADLFVVMARKGVCFFDLLKDDGMIHLTPGQKMISSSALDFSPTISPDTKVVITDDIMISGTSISNVANSLIDQGVSEKNISIIVLAIDSDNMKLSFKTETGRSLLQCGWTLPNSDCIELSSQISNVLSFFGRPYDVDFPVYNPVILDKSYLGKILNQNIWKLYNVTNSIQASGEIEVITLIPKDSTLDGIWRAMGFHNSGFAHIKIRIFIKHISAKNVALQLVPFTLFYEIGYTQIDELCATLTGLSFQDLEYSSKLRICQFVLCHRLAVFFSKITKCGINFSFRESVVTSLFGYDLADCILDLVCRRSSLNVNETFVYEDSPIDLLNYGESASDSVLDCIQKREFHSASADDRELNIRLLQPFISWYLTMELPTRKEMAQGRYNFRRDRELIREKTYRLNSGYSFRALNTIFSDEGNIYDLPDAISAFLDRSIDLGIIVPIMFDNRLKKTVCRAFRHGEDLPFGVADRSRVLYFLQELQVEFERLNCEGIAHVSLEKILVLFIQMAIRDRGVFNQFLGFRNREMLSIRYSVHGAVVTTIQPIDNKSELKFYFDSAPYWDWITKYLDNNGMIVQRQNTANRPNYYICSDAFAKYENQFNNICTEIQVKIKKYASMFAEWYGAMQLGQRDEFKAQTIQLSTCYSLPTVTLAIATELHYFIRYWEEEVLVYFQKYFEVPNSDMELKIEGFDVAKVLNSGREKYRWFKSGAHIETIGKVTETLRRTNPFLSAEWKGMWHPIATTTRPYGEEMVSKYQQCYCYLLICSAYYELLSGGEMADINTVAINQAACEKVEEYEKEFCEINIQYELEMDDFHEIFPFVKRIYFNKDKIRDRVTTLQSQVNNVLECAKQLIEDIQHLAGGYITENPVRFTNCVVVEIQCDDDAKCAAIVEEAWDALPDKESKTLVNIFELKAVAKDNSYPCYGIFYAQSEERSEINQDPMGKIISSIYKQANINCLNTRFLVFPQLPPKCRLKYRYVENMDKEIEQFNQNVCNKLFPFFRGNKSSQLIIVKKENSEIEENLELSIKFYERERTVLEFQTLNWGSLFDYECIHFDDGMTSFPCLEQQEMSNNSIASLRRFSGAKSVRHQLIGSATLCRCKETIIAITCMHCITKDPDQIYLLNLKKYGYKPLYGKAIPVDCDGADNLPAYNEIAVLDVYWDENCTQRVYFQPGVILDVSSGNFSLNASRYSCFGYPSSRGLTANATMVNDANDGYIEFLIDDISSFQEGFSGALFIDEEKKPFAIAYSFQEAGCTHAYGIPISTAFQRVQDILDERRVKHEI